MLEDRAPAGFLRDGESATGPILVGFVQNRRELVVVALGVFDQSLQLFVAFLVAKREEAEKDDRKDVALVVGWLDGRAQLDRSLKELAQELGVTVGGGLGFGLTLAFFVFVPLGKRPSVIAKDTAGRRRVVASRPHGAWA